jgi:hypothetical protein
MVTSSREMWGTARWVVINMHRFLVLNCLSSPADGLNT